MSYKLIHTILPEVIILEPKVYRDDRGFFLETYSKSAISTLFFVSNLFFWSTGEEYAAFSSLYHPLLHTWSLAVEEQFYLIFPLFIFFTPAELDVSHFLSISRS